MFEVSDTGPVGVLTVLSELIGGFFESALIGLYEFDYAAVGVFTVGLLAHVKKQGMLSLMNVGTEFNVEFRKVF